MLILRSFINLFMVPVVALYFFMKRDITIKKGFEKQPEWFKILVQYCIIVACNIPLTRFFTFVAKLVAGINIEADSSYYTVVALIATLIMPWIYTIAPKVLESLEKEDDLESEEQSVAEDNTISDKEKQIL